MPKIIYQPSSSPRSQENYEKTVERRQRITHWSRFFAHDSAQFADIQAAHPSGDCLVWGTRPGPQNTPHYHRIEPNDVVVFYRERFLISKATVTHTGVENRDLAFDLWREGKDHTHKDAHGRATL